MADEKPKTVTVEALEYHTYDGKEYQVGDTYEIDEQLADSVAAQGKAVRVDRDTVAKKSAKAADKSAADQKKGGRSSTAVDPMTLKQDASARSRGKSKAPLAKRTGAKRARTVRPSAARRTGRSRK